MRPLILFSLALVLAATGACGKPPELREKRKSSVVPVPSGEPSTSALYPPGFTPRPTADPSSSAGPSAAPYPEVTTTPCPGKVTAAQVIALVRQQASLQPSEAILGPFCSGSWHYTILEIPGPQEPVQVVTRDPLRIVAVGTEVCTAEVRAQAPAGIKAWVC